MARTIWKYKLGIEDTQEIKVPPGAELVSVQMQMEDMVLWAIVDPELLLRTARTIYIVGTGNPMPAGILKFIGTVQWHLYGLVWHVFEG